MTVTKKAGSLLQPVTAWTRKIVAKVPSRVWKVGFLVIAFCAAVALVTLLPRGLITADDIGRGSRRIELQNDLRATLVQAMGGALLLGGLYYTARSHRLNQEGQITDRFTRAIDQLGAEQMELRLGGIYALERIARDSRRDYQSICEILLTFIRERAPWRPTMIKGALKPTVVTRDHLDSDIQAVVVVLGRRQPASDALLELNISYCDLAHGSFHGGALKGTLFFGSNLQYANFNAADLSDSFLIQVDASDAFFEGANLRRATLEQSTFRDASFHNADLRGAQLRNAVLEGANFDGARLEGADLRGARTSGADFSNAKTDAKTIMS